MPDFPQYKPTWSATPYWDSRKDLPELRASSQNRPIPIKKDDPLAVMPTRGSSEAAGWDLYSCQPATVPAKGQCIIDTGICCAMPHGVYGRVAPRSGLAVKHQINVGVGVIDSDYRGRIKVLLQNMGDVPFDVKIGDRIAQIIFEPILLNELIEVKELPITHRNESGFGSTGTN